jgi:hypothetical protein
VRPWSLSSIISSMLAAIAIFLLNQRKKGTSMLAAIANFFLNQRNNGGDASLRSVGTEMDTYSIDKQVTSTGGSSGELWYRSYNGGLQPSGTGCTTCPTHSKHVRRHPRPAGFGDALV